MAKKKVIVYSQTNCQPCQMVKRYLTNNGVDFEERNIENKKYFKQLEKLNYTSTPVTVIGDKHVVGFNLDELENLIYE